MRTFISILTMSKNLQIKICLAILALLVFKEANAQVLFGPKLGYQLSWTHYAKLYDGPIYAEGFNFSPQIGGIYSFNISDKIAFYSELYYARRDKTEKTNEETTLLRQHQVKNHMIEVPLMLRLSFPLKKKRNAPRFYVNAGPQAAFWLGGNGELSSLERFGGRNVIRTNYKVSFSPKEGEATFYAEDANRLQFGLSAGSGLLIPLNRSGHQLQIDFRYTYGTTFLGSNLDLPIGQTEVEENLSYGHSIVGFSAAYAFYTDIWGMRKGKSIRRK